MATYVAFLRAINLGKARRVPMPDLVRCLGDAGFEGVETYLATGNVRLESRMRSQDKVGQSVEEACAECFGFEVPALVRAGAEVVATLDEADGIEGASGKRYVTWLRQPADRTLLDSLKSWDEQSQGAVVGTHAIHWWSDGGVAVSAPGQALAAPKLGATTRTLDVVRTVAERWCG